MAPPATLRTPAADRPGLLHRLQCEWEAMRVDPRLLRRVHEWGLGISVQSLDDVAVAAGWYRTASERLAADGARPVEAERVLRQLVVVARHDDVAARVVLQRLLPGLVREAQRWSRRSDGSPAALDELLAAAWVAIRTFRSEQRSGPVAPSLLSDASYHAFVRQGRRRAQFDPHPHDHFDRIEADRPVSSWDELHDLLSSVLTGGRTALTSTDRRLLGLLLSGCGPEEIAARLGVSVRTVTNRRHDLVERLRVAVASAA